MDHPEVHEIPVVTVAGLAERHAAVFLDAYGVLVDGHGALPGAAEAVADLNARGIPWLVLTNDASRQGPTAARRFASLGLDIPAARVLSSGELLPEYFTEHGLVGARCVVLGSGDSAAFVAAAGGEVVAPSVDSPADVLVVCDEAGYPFLDTAAEVLSMLFHAVDAGRPLALLLPNPDLIYPRREGRYGFTAGTVAQMFESALALRYPGAEALRFARLGKPHPPIFAEACRRGGTRGAGMGGDQLVTDIAGAHGFGIASALVTTGLTRLEEVARSTVRPTYLVGGW